MRCKICPREALNQYCIEHNRAYDNIVKGYNTWKRGMEISYKEYLKEVVRNKFTGFWAKEVAKKELSEI